MERTIILPNISSDKIFPQEINDDLDYGIIIVYCEDSVVGSVMPENDGGYRMFTMDTDEHYDSLLQIIEVNYTRYTFKYITND